MKMNPVGWFEIYVSDMTRARAFYEQVLGLQLSSLGSPTPEVELWAFPMDREASGASGALASMKGQQPSGNSTIVYFHCADCAVEAQRVPSAGGKILKEKFSIGQYGFIAMIADPEGNVVGLHSMK
jgi:predicted enzyme related to lactoylglutathione lyase